ncbi:MAG: hypothetical protein OEY03_01705 [Rhizobacter sp.]|nr:hypothetical protein [Rhizobacter sp.]
MSSQAHTLPQVHAPRIAVPVGQLDRFASAAKRFGKTVWHQLELIGYSRARRVLLSTAERYEVSQPDLAAQLREAARYNPWQ